MLAAPILYRVDDVFSLAVIIVSVIPEAETTVVVTTVVAAEAAGVGAGVAEAEAVAVAVVAGLAGAAATASAAAVFVRASFTPKCCMHGISRNTETETVASSTVRASCGLCRGPV